MSFKNLNKMDVSEQNRAEWSSPYLNGGVSVLHVAPAGQHNEPYFAALLKKTRKNRRQLESQMFTPAFIKKNRNNDRELYAAHVIKGWDGIINDDGDEVPFSVEACGEFLAELPPWIFDAARDYCTTPENFIDEPVEVEETAGN